MKVMKKVNVALLVLTMAAAALVLSGCGLFDTYDVFTGSTSASKYTTPNSYEKKILSESEAALLVKSLSGSKHSWTATQIHDYLDENGFSSSQANTLGPWLRDQDCAAIYFTKSSGYTIYYIIKY